MATLFGSPPFLSHPITTTTTATRRYFSSPSQSPPPASQPQPQPSTQSTPRPPPNSISTSQISVKPQQQEVPSKPTIVESTDWIASSLTRRFGLGAGLAWVGFLAFGVISEQIKTRLEVSQQESNTREVEKPEEVVLPNGIRYYELRVGGGSSPRVGDLVVMDVKGCVEDSGEIFLDTFGGGERKRPVALVMGSRPYSRGICDGIESVLTTMKAGGKRRVIIPPSMCFGEKGADLGSGSLIPPFASLEYIIQVDKVSIAPA